MSLFAPRKESAVQAFVVSLLNESCHAVQRQEDGPRVERRVNLTKVVMVVPVEAKKLLVNQAFTAITKEFSSTGVAMVVDHVYGPDEAVLGFRSRGGIAWVPRQGQTCASHGWRFLSNWLPYDRATGFGRLSGVGKARILNVCAL